MKRREDRARHSAWSSEHVTAAGLSRAVVPVPPRRHGLGRYGGHYGRSNYGPSNRRLGRGDGGRTRSTLPRIGHDEILLDIEIVHSDIPEA